MAVEITRDLANKAVDMAKAGGPTEGRVKWSMPHGAGRSHWTSIDDARAIASNMNEKYGDGTHWVEAR